MNTPHKHSLPITDDPRASVPVFDCHVLLTPPCEGSPQFRGRVSNLPEITAQAGSERDCLRKLVDQFKSFVSNHLQSGTPIPWQVPPATRAEGEQERWIPVHM